MQELSRRDILKAGSGLGLWALSPWAMRVPFTQAQADRPNVVIIYTDDQAFSQFGCYGGQPTPNIDRMAKNGLRMDRYYACTALCAPSRYGLQTGRYASAAPGMLRQFAAGTPINLLQNLGDEHNRPPERWNMPAALKEAGYRTGFVGKYHMGFMGERARSVGETCLDDPEKLKLLHHNFELAQKGAYAGGYDFAEGLYHDNPQPDNFYRDVMYHNQDWVTWNALKFLDQSQGRPFLLVMNPTLVHWPPEQDSLQADRSVTPVGRVDFPDVQPSRASVLERAQQVDGRKYGWFGEAHKAGVIWLDDAVGVILKRLEDLGVAENTIVFVLSDHGRNGKWTCNEGGIRTGGVVYWPGRIEPGRVSRGLVQNVDIAPTVLEICGVDPLPDADMHGVSVADHLLSGAPSGRKYAYAEIGYQRTVIDERGMKYMALRYPEAIEKQRRQGVKFDLRGRRLKDQGKAAEPVDALYDIAREIPPERPLAFSINKPEQQMKDLVDAPAHAEDVARLKQALVEVSRRLPHSFGEFTRT
jgi:arylsulfatase A-like enzyme